MHVQDDKICTYKYTTKQEEFGKKHDNDISMGATVLVLCNSGEFMHATVLIIAHPSIWN